MTAREMAWKLFVGWGGSILILVLVAFTFSPDTSAEVEDVADFVKSSMPVLPAFVNDSTSVRKVEETWGNELIIHLDNGHTYRLTVELRSY